MTREKLIFLDIDGTLAMPGSSTPPDSALDAIRAAQENGHKVFICTGRSLAMTRPVLRYPFDGAVTSAGGHIECGGAAIYDRPMTAEELSRVRAALSDDALFYVLEGRDGTFADMGMERVLRRPGMEAGLMNSELARWRKVLTEDFGTRPLEEYDGSPVYKLTFLSVEQGAVDRARAELEAEYAFVMQEFFQGVRNGEVIPRVFDKGQAVLRVCGHYGAAREDTIAFGDSMNDLPMIEAAGLGVCMGNGSAELKRRSGLVCPSVEEDGLAAAFRELGLV